MQFAEDSLIIKLIRKAITGINFLTPLLDLGLRLWVARVFWNSGIQKTASWDSTLMLFEYEYAVPLLSAQLAATMATAAELVIPVMLVVGIFTRLNIVALFILNFVAAISYPDISPAGEKDHIMWGLACVILFFYGPGRAAIDYFIRKRWFV